jgi:DtxR family Mn-dependent transcriptional regulator
MTPVLQEEILEMLLAAESGIAESILQAAGHAQEDLRNALHSLEKNGHITLADGIVRLTRSGKEKAGRIARKHAALESFLTGKTPESENAEGHTSHKNLTGKNPVVPLSGCPEGSLLHVATIRSFDKHSILLDLGVIPGELITLKRKLDNNAVVISVKGCDIALSPEITASIMVEQCGLP